MPDVQEVTVTGPATSQLAALVWRLAEDPGVVLAWSGLRRVTRRPLVPVIVAADNDTETCGCCT